MAVDEDSDLPEWYHPEATRSLAIEMLTDARDGSFMVWPAASHVQQPLAASVHFLSVRHGGRILHNVLAQKGMFWTLNSELIAGETLLRAVQALMRSPPPHFRQELRAFIRRPPPFIPVAPEWDSTEEAPQPPPRMSLGLVLPEFRRTGSGPADAMMAPEPPPRFSRITSEPPSKSAWAQRPVLHQDHRRSAAAPPPLVLSVPPPLPGNHPPPSSPGLRRPSKEEPSPASPKTKRSSNSVTPAQPGSPVSRRTTPSEISGLVAASGGSSSSPGMDARRASNAGLMSPQERRISMAHAEFHRFNSSPLTPDEPLRRSSLSATAGVPPGSPRLPPANHQLELSAPAPPPRNSLPSAQSQSTLMQAQSALRRSQENLLSDAPPPPPRSSLPSAQSQPSLMQAQSALRRSHDNLLLDAPPPPPPRSVSQSALHHSRQNLFDDAAATSTSTSNPNNNSGSGNNYEDASKLFTMSEADLVSPGHVLVKQEGDIPPLLMHTSHALGEPVSILASRSEHFR
jgi:hypothetical protein